MRELDYTPPEPTRAQLEQQVEELADEVERLQAVVQAWHRWCESPQDVGGELFQEAVDLTAEAVGDV